MMFRVLVKSYYDSLWCIQDYYIITWIIAYDSIGWIPVVSIHHLFDLLGEFSFYSNYTKAMTMTWFALLELPINGFQTMMLCILSFILNRVRQLRVLSKQNMYFCFFCPKQTQGFKPSAVHLNHYICGVPHPG